MYAAVLPEGRAFQVAAFVGMTVSINSKVIGEAFSESFKRCKEVFFMFNILARCPVQDFRELVSQGFKIVIGGYVETALQPGANELYSRKVLPVCS